MTAAFEPTAFDAAFEIGTVSTSLHGRKPRRRGRTIRFADEFDAPVYTPIRTVADLAEAKAEIADLRGEIQALAGEIEQIKAQRVTQARQRAVAALQAEYDAIAAELAAVVAAEQAWWQRLRDEDEFLLLAA